MARETGSLRVRGREDLNPELPYYVVEVSDETESLDPFFLREIAGGRLAWTWAPRGTAGWTFLSAEYWDGEFGGLASYADLEAAVQDEIEEMG